MITQEAKRATNEMIGRWSALAPSITVPTGHPARDRTGELVVIGSGIAHQDLTLNDESRVLGADRVFYCTNDRVTQTWITKLRPDSLDLRILYDSQKDRYDTYVQMAEAMLCCVRNAQKVLAIYYGHPGIFATPAHRALKIARREGFRAVMRPGISALDYLVADVGFDPMTPGLASFDASDVLLAHRRIDPTLHVVLWQVGMVGEFKFSSSGFENVGFAPLVDLLEQIYGGDWEVVHYVASQYAGVEPLIERHPISSLRRKEISSRLSWLSTFYIPPAPHRQLSSSPPPRRQRSSPAGDDYESAAYGPRELAAIRRINPFRAPEHYVTPPPSPAAEFMLELSRDLDLEAAYRDDPVKFIARAGARELTERAIKLLGMTHPLAINAAFWEPAATERAAAGPAS